MNRIVALSAGIMALAGVAVPATAEGEINRGVGQKVAVTPLPADSPGSAVLDGLESRPATVLVFTGVSCPIGDLYFPRLNELAARYRPNEVTFLAIDSNRGRTGEELAEQASAFALTFPQLLDSEQLLADALQAERTCEALVIDGEGVLRYRGAIDDQYGLGRAKEAPEHSYLVDALEAVLADRDVETAATSVTGCPIERARPETATDLTTLDVPERVNRLITAASRVRAPGAELSDAWAQHAPDEDALIDEVGQVNWASDVAPIVQAKCMNCHRPGEVGPFPLLSFEDVTKRLEGVREVVDLRRMPPWHADPRFGHFANDRSLSSRERAIMLAWIEQGAPAGDRSAEPTAPAYANGWTIGQPDLIVRIDRPYTIKAEGFERYQRFPIALDLKEDIWIQAAEARPSDRSVVHHIIAYLIPPGQRTPDVERGHLVGYAPGDMPSICPEGTAKRIPAGSSLLVEVHYTPNGRIRQDQSSVGFVLARKPIDREAVTIGIVNERIRIPAGAADHPEASRMVIRQPMKLLAFMPHMHLRGKAFDYFATFPDGSTERLLSVPAYDFGWQSYYTLAEPRELKPGDRLDCVARYDNSTGNPVNPSPDKEVRWGDQTWQEMMIGYIDVSIPLAERVTPGGDRAAE